MVFLIAACAMGVITLLCRWVFSTGHRVPVVVPPAAPRDLGLLVPVAEVRTRADAEMLVELLREAGVRASISDLQVLVFGKDAEQARRLVSTP